MDAESRSVNARDFSALAGQDSSLWSKLLGVDVEHAVYGPGKVSKVEARRNYAPLITLAFRDITKVWPPTSFESGKTMLLLAPGLATLVDQAAAQLADRRRLEAEIEEERAEEIVAAEAAAKAEAKRWADLSPQEQHRERMAKLVERHRRKLARLGIQFKGIRSTSRIHRVTHCYECHDPLDNSIDVECIGCNWILCECGACGCGYRKS